MAAADNGKDALSFIRQYRPDICIIDINMPELDGLEVIRRVKESDIKTRFLILSGYDEFSYAQTAIRHGVKSYFLKPLNMVEFREEFSKQCREILANRCTSEEFVTYNLSSLVDSSRILFLNQLIQNKIHSLDDINTKLSVLNLSIANTSSCVAVFSLHARPEDEVPKPADINNQYICGALGNYNMESWVYDDNQIIAILNLNDSDNRKFRNHLQACVDGIKSETPYQIIVGVGNTVPGLNQCFLSYSRALEALSYHIYGTAANIYDSSMISDKKPSFSKENIDFKPIVSYITHNNTTGITGYCDTFFNSLFFVKMPPPNFIIGMCMYLIMNVQKQITLLHPDKKIEFDFTYQEISAFESVIALKEWLIHFFICYSEMLKDTTGDSNSIIKASKEYIQNNLHRNIKTKEVAAQVNLSESYFSIYFKDKTGITFRDYILKTRINYAKKLLKSKEVSISEIAYLIGYQDYRSFSRAFKNETGMTPSEYGSSMDEKPK